MTDAVFDGCVLLLLFLADLLGMTYKAINVWIFVIIWPAFTLTLIAIVVWQRLQIRRLQGRPAKENCAGAR
jgi:branched-subunit amino acid ABC-type transport system permease component